jgi:predicted DNA-binding protein (MmcQ/YjbR family)
MDHKTVETYVLSMPNVRLDYPFGEGVAVYKVEDPGSKTSSTTGHGKMFALIAEGKDPVRISLKCDPALSKVLRANYTEVMEGYHLNKKHWNTIVLSGQLTWEEIKALIRHSYDLVTGAPDHPPEI